jgi:uroporphyrinogen-III synthase
MRRALILRPEPGASATLRRARERGLDAIAIPLFDIEPVAWEVPETNSFDGILLTSANAVRFGGDGLQQLRGLPVYGVGEATAEAAREEGFDIASVGDSGIDRLLGSIEPHVKLLHLAGENRKERVDAPQEILAVTVYRSRAKEGVDLRGIEGSVALVHSPRAGRRFSELTRTLDRASIALVAISRDAANAAGAGWASVEVAQTPGDEGLLALAERLCNNTPAK